MKVKLPCKKCNKEFQSEYKYIRVGQGLYCSRSCAQFESVLSNRLKKKPVFKVKCTECRKTIINPKTKDGQKKYFCNTKCYAAYRKIEHYCWNCKKKYNPKTVTQRTCSKKCLDKIKEKKTKIKKPKNMNESIFKKLKRKYHNIKAKAFQRKLEFSLNIQDLIDLWMQQNGKCAYTGKKLVFTNTEHSPFQLSIDRINSSKGYVKGNIVMCSYWINNAKSTFAIQRLTDLCEQFVNFQKTRRGGRVL